MKPTTGHECRITNIFSKAESLKITKYEKNDEAAKSRKLRSKVAKTRHISKNKVHLQTQGSDAGTVLGVDSPDRSSCVFSWQQA
jgi:hypothetical protein